MQGRGRRHHTQGRSPSPKAAHARGPRGGTLNPLQRIAPLVDDFEPWDGPRGGVTGGDPLGFPGYADLLTRAREKAAADEAVVTGRGQLEAGGGSTLPVAIIGFVFEFIGGSMGAAVGERVVRAYDRAREQGIPVLVVAASGGARMQEGMASLIQMARTADAARRHADAGLLQVAYLTSPTTGGVYASFSSLADVVWGEPGATIGFAGPRVVEQTTGEALPEGAHTSDSARAAGVVDDVMPAAEARERLRLLLRLTHLARNPHAEESRESGPAAVATPPTPVASAWDEVQRARDPERPSGRWWLERLVPERVELSGDRAGGIDPVTICALGVTEGGQPVAAVALDRPDAPGRPATAPRGAPSPSPPDWAFPS